VTGGVIVKQGFWGMEVTQQGPGAEPHWGTEGKALRSRRYNENCAYKTGFCASSVCILLLTHAVKLKRHTVGGMMYLARGVWIGVR